MNRANNNVYTEEKKSNYQKLFEPIKIGGLSLRTRTAMAPMTRCFSDDITGEVNDEIAEYYRRRAADGIGLIISEGTVISPRAKGHPGVPGLFTRNQIRAWKKVTNAIHNEGGTTVAQLWHVGRLSYSQMTGGDPPLAPSAIKAGGHAKRSRPRRGHDTPVEMSLDDIKEVINQYSQSAKNAIEAGFDGIEIHGAHGYLIDQFNWDASNKRNDRYGGDLQQRFTFMKEVLAAVIDAIGADRVIMRFSIWKLDQPDFLFDDNEEIIKAFVDAFKEVGLKIIHPSTKDYSQVIQDGMKLHQLVRKHWDEAIIGVGDLNPKTADQALQEGAIDVAAFARPLLANPDFIQRIKNREELVTYDKDKHLWVLK
ncbi:alkene reductase [Bacillus sp. B15-48]|nr:alkene reductase [Bacillus sp. B15-48]